MKVEIVDKLKGYKSSWLLHVTIVDSSWMEKEMMNYGQNRGRRLGRHFYETIRRDPNRSIKA